MHVTLNSTCQGEIKHKYPRSDFTGVNYLDLCSVLFFKHKNDVVCSSTQLAPSCGDIQNNLISPSGVCVCFLFEFLKSVLYLVATMNV